MSIELDRYDVSIALQVWQRFFVLAATSGGISMDAGRLAADRNAALEFLARGRLMQVLSIHLDGILCALDRAAQVSLAQAREDVPALIDELDAHYAEFGELLKMRLDIVREKGASAVLNELARVPEVRAAHRALLVVDLEQLEAMAPHDAETKPASKP